jgi:transposase-like protein
MAAYVGAERYERTERREGWRNGSYSRGLDTELGWIKELKVPRCRKKGFRTKIFKRYQRRVGRVNEAIKEMFIHGVSTRKVKKVTKALLGESYSAQTVSNICKELKAEVAKFHQRKIEGKYKYLILDGVYISIKGATGAKRYPVLCVYGVKEDGRRELLDFRLASTESESAWVALLESLRERGLEVNEVKLIVTDGGKGVRKACEIVFAFTEKQLCWAHKMRNVTAKVKKRDRDKVKLGAIKIYNAKNRREAIKNFRCWKEKWQRVYPEAVKCVERDLEMLLAFYKFPKSHWKKIRTTNVIERLIREVRRRTCPIGSFNDKDSAERIVYTVFKSLNEKWKDAPVKEFTQNYCFVE